MKAYRGSGVANVISQLSKVWSQNVNLHGNDLLIYISLSDLIWRRFLN
jgi:hypothetical protein